MMYRVLFFFVVVVVVFVTFDFEDFKVPSITVNSPFDGSISGEGGGGTGDTGMCLYSGGKTLQFAIC